MKSDLITRADSQKIVPSQLGLPYCPKPSRMSTRPENSHRRPHDRNYPDGLIDGQTYRSKAFQVFESQNCHLYSVGPMFVPTGKAEARRLGRAPRLAAAAWPRGIPTSRRSQA